MCNEVSPGSVVEINHAGRIDVADNEVRAAITVQIRRDHGVRQCFRFLKLNARTKVALAVVEVDKAAELFGTCGNVGITVAV
jgi:hypothetical protein